MSDLFIHLRFHSAYSLLEGAVRLEQIVPLCRRYEMPAIAITDSNNMFGAMAFAELLAGEGIQPIMGCSFSLSDVRGRGGYKRKKPQLAFLAKDEEGYGHLMRLASLAQGSLAEDNIMPQICFEDIAKYHEGLICLTGGYDGVLDQFLLQNREGEAEKFLERLKLVFSDRLYLELQRHGRAEEKQKEAWLLDRAGYHGLGVVASNDIHFCAREEFDSHDVLLAIADGVKVNAADRRRLTPEHYFKSKEEMVALFADLPEAISNSVEIARRCAFCPRAKAPVLPRFDKKGDRDEENEGRYLIEQAKAGLDKRLALLKEKEMLAVEERVYRERLDRELKMIIEMGFAGYFLIVADFVGWALERKIPVGPGRGSGAGSLVAYALRITDLDPLRFGLIFERFLNPERVSMPDFDIDFCQERRDEVVRYVSERYGSERVAHIITFGSLQARAVLRDVGRALGMPYGQVDRLCQFIPNNPAHPVKLAEAIEKEPVLQEARRDDPQVGQLLDISLRLEGLYRHASTHAAGVVIGNQPLNRMIPMAKDPRTHMRITQFSMKWVEKAGLVKFDFLGLKTLTALRLTCDLLAERGIDLDLGMIPLDDKETYALLSRAETRGIFQLESNGVRDVLRRAEPDRIEDLIAIIALYRPGPMDNIPNYIRGKKGEVEPDYLHPRLEPVLRETFGVIVYQEQVMRIARVLAGYSDAEADLLRRAMGKKIKAEMDQQRQRFVEGARGNQVEGSKARHIFDLVARFAGYGFNKSHAAAYALLAYQTGWLKTHYPVEFLAALMTLDMHNQEKIALLKQEASRMDIEVYPPDICRSEARFTVRDGAILHALAALRHVGVEAARHFVDVRNQNQGFKDIFDFTRVCGARACVSSDISQALSKRAFESLAAGGAFDSLHENRRQLFDNATTLINLGRGVDDHQASLFDVDEQARINLPKCEPWDMAECLSKELEAAGMYLSDHPLAPWQGKLESMGISSWQEFSDSAQLTGRLAGVITVIHERRSRKGNAFVFLGLSDLTGTYEVVVFSELLRQSRSLMEVGRLVVMDIGADRDRESLRVRAQTIHLLDEKLPVMARRKMQLRLFLDEVEGGVLDAIKRQLEARPGGTRILLVVPSATGSAVEIALPGGFAVSTELTDRLRAMPGISRIDAA